jgi:hypothetical protein
VRTLQPSPHQPDEVLFADDVVSFAQANGLWSPPSSSLSSNIKDDGNHSSFDISDVYDPVRWRCVCMICASSWLLGRIFFFLLFLSFGASIILNIIVINDAGDATGTL